MQDVFHPLGDTFVVAAATTAPAGIQVLPTAQNDKVYPDHYRIFNPGDETVYVGYGKDATEAQANAVAPIAGTEQKCIPVPASSVEVIKLGEGVWLSGLTVTNSVSLFVTVGKGV